jgi:dolichol kinase
MSQYEAAYQRGEWLLLLSIYLLPGHLVWTPETLYWATAVLLATCLAICISYDARLRWTSLLLYTVVLPHAISFRKESSLLLGAVPYLLTVFNHVKLLGSWTPTSGTSVEMLGYAFSGSLRPLLGVQFHALGRVLAGTSLNEVELSLLSQALTAFTWRYMTQECAFYETLLFGMLGGLLIACAAADPFLKQSMRLAKIKPHHRPKNCARLKLEAAGKAYGVLAGLVVFAIRPWINHALDQDVFLWLVNYVTLVRLCLIVYWVAVAGTGVIVVIYFWGSKPVGGLSGLPRNALKLLSPKEDDVFFEDEDTQQRRARALDRRRKFFHGLVVVLFLPTLNRDPGLSYLALSLATAAFLFEEVIRVAVLAPFGISIHKFLSGFTDHRDHAGHLVVSHLFLLLGVASPVWLSLTDSTTPQVSLLSGVLTLGVGDAAASIIGKKYGRHKYPGLKKSFEGTFAFILAVCLGGYIAAYFGWTGTPANPARFFIGATMTGLLEGISTENDNLIISVYMWCWLS